MGGWDLALTIRSLTTAFSFSLTKTVSCRCNLLQGITKLTKADSVAGVSGVCL